MLSDMFTKNKKPSKLWLVLIVIPFVTCLFSACTEDDPDPAEEFISLLASLDWGSDTCFVYGHKTPDVDAVTSALAYAKLMRALGFNCKAKVSSNTNKVSQYIAGVFGFDLPELKSNVATHTRLILTDRSDYAQCVDGAREAIILQKIDHHVEGDIRDNDIPFVRREMVGATNTIIYEMYQELGITIDNETDHILLAGIISDTRNLSKSTTKGLDSTAWLALTTQLGISPDSAARLNAGMESAAYNYSGMTDTEIFLSDYKEYEINGQMIGFGSMVCKQADMDNFIDQMLSVMPDIMQQKGVDMVFAKIDNLVPYTRADRTINPSTQNGIYFLYNGEGAPSIAKEIFGPSLRSGVCYSSKNYSRKQIIPLITEILNR